jgi:hypothetical protein
VADEDAADDGDLSDNQDGLPGMHGTFRRGGVDCEECHGMGAQHAFVPGSYTMTVDDSNDLCGRCHTDADGVGGEYSAKTLEELSAFAAGIHTEVLPWFRSESESLSRGKPRGFLCVKVWIRPIGDR